MKYHYSTHRCMHVYSHKPKSATRDRSTVDNQQSRRVLLIHQAIFRFFSGTEVKITCQQVLFPYLEALFFRHAAFFTHVAIFPFHSLLRTSFRVPQHGAKTKPRFKVSSHQNKRINSLNSNTMYSFRQLFLLLSEKNGRHG